MLRLGNIELDMPVIQSAISGYSDRPMRVLARQFGAPMTFAGLMLDKSTAHAKMWAKPEFGLSEDEHPIGGQLVGTEPEMMARAAKVMEEKGFDLVDLNFACPAPKVLARKRGGHLLNEPERAVEIFNRVRESVKCPVTLKLRRAFYEDDQEREYFWRICAGAVNGGVDALIVHGRAVEQRYRGEADWETVEQVKERFPDTVVIGSGDLFTATSAVERLQSNRVDGVVLARGAIGNPWIFRKVKELLEGDGQYVEPSVAEVGEVLLKHFEMVQECYPPRKSIPYFRKFCVGYCRRHPERKKTLLALMAATTADEIRQVVNERFMSENDE
jgi:tRNA-dihydrouridine synthase B